MPGSSAQRQLFGLVRSVQKGERPLDSVHSRARDMAMKMTPKDSTAMTPDESRESSEAIETGEKSSARFLGAIWFMAKRANALAAVESVRKSIHQAGAKRRETLEKEKQRLHKENETLRKELARSTQETAQTQAAMSAMPPAAPPAQPPYGQMLTNPNAAAEGGASGGAGAHAPGPAAPAAIKPVSPMAPVR